MQKPNGIRIANMLLYINLAFSLFVLVMYTGALMNPPADQAGKIPYYTSGQLTVFFLNMLLPIAASLFTLYFIRTKKRFPAILAALGVLITSTALAYQVMLCTAILVMLFLRSSRQYFSNGVQPVPAQAQRMAVPSAEDVSETDEQAESGEAAAVTAPRAPKTDPVVEIRPVGSGEAADIHSVMIAAFEDYRTSVPPSSALEETVESVREALESGQGAAILYEDGKPTGAVRYEIEGDTITFFRLSVIPSRRRRGYARRLIKWIEHLAVSKGLNAARCKVRQSVQNNVAMYQNMGYEIIDQELVVRPAGTVKAAVLEKKLGV